MLITVYLKNAISSASKGLSNDVLYLCRKGTLSSLCKQLDALSTTDGATVSCVQHTYMHLISARIIATAGSHSPVFDRG